MFKVSTLKIDLEQTKTGSSTPGAVDGGTGSGGVESNFVDRKTESGQTFVSDDLSALAPQTVEMLNLWNDFRKVVAFIDENRSWLSHICTVFGGTIGCAPSNSE